MATIPNQHALVTIIKLGKTAGVSTGIKSQLPTTSFTKAELSLRLPKAYLEYRQPKTAPSAQET